jgi:hypothetical protein
MSLSLSVASAFAAFGYFASCSATNPATSFSHSAFVGAFIISGSAAFALGCRLFGSLSSTLAILCTHSRSSRCATNSPSTSGALPGPEYNLSPRR